MESDKIVNRKSVVTSGKQKLVSECEKHPNFIANFIEINTGIIMCDKCIKLEGDKHKGILPQTHSIAMFCELEIEEWDKLAN